jgi:hypothetical protein
MPTTVEQPQLPSGEANPNYVDVLDEDPVVAGQKFVCMSFLSPEKLLKAREHFMFEQYLKTFSLRKSVEQMGGFLAFVAYKHGLDAKKLNDSFEEYLQEEKSSLASLDVTDDYATFTEHHDERLAREFDEAHDFQTSVRSLKIRGSFGSQTEAENRAQALRRRDPNHNILVGSVGVWMPWDPEAYKTGRVEYLEGLQNRLMQEKQKSEVAAKEHFDQRVLDAKRDAIEENKERARVANIPITQDIKPDGTLISVGPTHGLDSVRDTAAMVGGEVQSASVQNELFGENVIIPRK